MHYIHEELCARFAWYDRWHKDPHANAVTWSIFLLIAILYASSLVNSIGDSMYELGETTQVSLARMVVREPVPGSSLEVLSNDELIGRMEAMTNIAFIALREYNEATPESAFEKLEALRNVLIERDELLQKLATADPDGAERFLMDENTRSLFPEAVRSAIRTP